MLQLSKKMHSLVDILIFWMGKHSSLPKHNIRRIYLVTDQEPLSYEKFFDDFQSYDINHLSFFFGTIHKKVSSHKWYPKLTISVCLDSIPIWLSIRSPRKHWHFLPDSVVGKMSKNVGKCQEKSGNVGICQDISRETSGKLVCGEPSIQHVSWRILTL